MTVVEKFYWRGGRRISYLRSIKTHSRMVVPGSENCQIENLFNFFPYMGKPFKWQNENTSKFVNILEYRQRNNSFQHSNDSNWQIEASDSHACIPPTQITKLQAHHPSLCAHTNTNRRDLPTTLSIFRTDVYRGNVFFKASGTRQLLTAFFFNVPLPRR